MKFQLPHVKRRALFAAVPLLLALAPACALGPLDDPTDPASDGTIGEARQALDVRLRVMAANLSSGNYQSYDAGHGSRIFQGVDPDIVMIQEFNYGSNGAADLRSFVDTAFGTSFSYYREAGAQIPNGIISRYPILASGEWNDASVSNRDFAWARIDIPGPVDLWAVSVHFLTSSSTARNTEAKSLVSYIKAAVPAGDYLVIGADLNTGSRGEACVTTLAQVTVTAGPWPADKNGNTNTNASRGNPYDWLLADANLNARKTSVVLGTGTFTNGLVVDTRVYTPLANISPALFGDSGASNMQHMGVIRDFWIPN